jgi:hypothetical protein
VLELSPKLSVEKPRGKARLGDTVGDYGGSHESLNFELPAPPSATQAVGKFKFGAIEKDALDHTDLGKRRRCYTDLERMQWRGHRELLDASNDQELCMAWLFALLFSMADVTVEFFYPVAVMLFGARTLPHLDSFYGGQPNACRIAGAGGLLLVDYRIPFRQCVVQFGCDYFVPIALFHKCGMKLRMLQLKADGTATVTEAYDYDWLKSPDVCVVGYLDYLVLQCNETNTVVTKHGPVVRETCRMVGIVPLYDPMQPEASLYYSPNEATYISSLDVLEAAKACPTRPETMHAPVVRKYTSLDKWFAFHGALFAHWWEGDPFVPRYNIYSRPMRQVCSPVACSQSSALSTICGLSSV